MPRRHPALVVLAVIVVGLAVGGAYGLWYVFLRPAGPPPVAIASGVGNGGGSATNDGGPASPGGGTTGALAGTWNVDDSIGSTADNSETFVGYRVQEQLAGIGGNTAVGRTSSVTGTLTLSGTQITAVDVTADLTTLASDDPQRDGQLGRQGIQTDQFPTAEFKLTQPIDLGSLPADGQTISATATGDLTLHGVTKSVQIAVSATLSSGIVTVDGSLQIQFADFGIEAPTSFHVLSVDDHGVMEFQLHFRHA
ncbi:MAG TPA: YceI family protein [Candidatus Limnocylindrales bacterium]|nr:YceI family protein [Candidatus Limnocylindrales bacterium]